MGLTKDYKSEYESFSGMKKRCYNPNCQDYSNYGGRGIRVGEEFLSEDGFRKFLDCLGPKPSSKHSLDRIEVNGNYELGNIKWSTNEEQANNRTDNIYITYQGKTQTLNLWCKELGLKYKRVQERMINGWDFERAISTPKSEKGTNSSSSKLSQEDVREIYLSTEEYKEISKKFQLATSSISLIKNRKRYIEETEGLGVPGRSSNLNNPSRNK